MGEYAKRLRDGANIKIGTCSSMYYCRYDQRNLIDYGYSTNNLLWRIPAIEEDGIEVGEFEFGGLYKKGFPLCSVRLWDFPKDSSLREVADDEGRVQLHDDKTGLVLSVPCHHGLKLPEDTGCINAFFNGRSNPIHLCFLKNTEKELRVGVKCASCEKLWSISFDEIEPYIISEDMKLRLLKQCSDYYFEHNGECPDYSVTLKSEKGLYVSLFLIGENFWRVMYDGRIDTEGAWDDCCEAFRHRLLDESYEEGGEE